MTGAQTLGKCDAVLAFTESIVHKTRLSLIYMLSNYLSSIYCAPESVPDSESFQ